MEKETRYAPKSVSSVQGHPLQPEKDSRPVRSMTTADEAECKQKLLNIHEELGGMVHYSNEAAQLRRRIALALGPSLALDEFATNTTCCAGGAHTDRGGHFTPPGYWDLGVME